MATVNKIAYASDGECLYAVLPINHGDVLATLVLCDDERNEIGERFKLLVGDLCEDYILYDADKEPITD